MSNTVAAYHDRIAGMSPDHIRETVERISSKEWQGSALDIGTGSGGWVKRLLASNSFEKIYSCDIIDCREDEAKDLEFFLVDLANQPTPLEDNSLDYVFAIEVIEHIENPRRFLREIHRILKPQGKFVMSTPSCDSLRSRISMLLRGYFPAFCDADYESSGHISPITRLEYKRMIKEAKFSHHQEYWEMPGQIPSSSMQWQSLFPTLKGHLWCDTFISIASK